VEPGLHPEVLAVSRKVVEKVRANSISNDVAHERVKESCLSELLVPSAQILEASSHGSGGTFGDLPVEYPFEPARRVDVIFPVEQKINQLAELGVGELLQPRRSVIGKDPCEVA
jgi:hypothetical protein